MNLKRRKGGTERIDTDLPAIGGRVPRPQGLSAIIGTHWRTATRFPRFFYILLWKLLTLPLPNEKIEQRHWQRRSKFWARFAPFNSSILVRISYLFIIIDRKFSKSTLTMGYILSISCDRDFLSIAWFANSRIFSSPFTISSQIDIHRSNNRTFDPTFRCLHVSSSSNELQKRDTAIAANRAVAKHRYAKSVSSIKYSVYRVGKVIRLEKCAYMVWLLFMRDLTSQMAVEELIISDEIFARFAFKVSVHLHVHKECKIWTMIISISSWIELYFVFEYIVSLFHELCL